MQVPSPTSVKSNPVAPWVTTTGAPIEPAPVKLKVTIWLLELPTGSLPKPTCAGLLAVAVSAAGQAQLVWYENKQVLSAPISREGVGTPARIGSVVGDSPPPSIAAGGKPGEWYLAWLDYEIGHLETYAARVQCK